MQLGSVPLNVTKELNECQVSSYKKKQKILPETSEWAKKGRKPGGNEAKVRPGLWLRAGRCWGGGGRGRFSRGALGDSGKQVSNADSRASSHCLSLVGPWGSQWGALVWDTGWDLGGGPGVRHHGGLCVATLWGTLGATLAGNHVSCSSPPAQTGPSRPPVLAASLRPDPKSAATQLCLCLPAPYAAPPWGALYLLCSGPSPHMIQRSVPTPAFSESQKRRPHVLLDFPRLPDPSPPSDLLRTPFPPAQCPHLTTSPPGIPSPAVQTHRGSLILVLALAAPLPPHGPSRPPLPSAHAHSPSQGCYVSRSQQLLDAASSSECLPST